MHNLILLTQVHTLTSLMTTHVTLFCSYEYNIFLHDNMVTSYCSHKYRSYLCDYVDQLVLLTYIKYLHCKIWFSHCVVHMNIQVFWGVTPCWMVNSYDISEEHSACVLRIKQYTHFGTVVYQLTLHNIPGDFNIH